MELSVQIVLAVFLLGGLYYSVLIFKRNKQGLTAAPLQFFNEELGPPPRNVRLNLSGTIPGNLQEHLRRSRAGMLMPFILGIVWLVWAVDTKQMDEWTARVIASLFVLGSVSVFLKRHWLLEKFSYVREQKKIAENGVVVKGTINALKQTTTRGYELAECIYERDKNKYVINQEVPKEIFKKDETVTMLVLPERPEKGLIYKTSMYIAI